MFKRFVLFSSLLGLIACSTPSVFKCDPLTGQDCSDGGPGSDGGLLSSDGGPGSDGGLLSSDGGPGSDGGLLSSDGGLLSSDGGLLSSDGGPGSDGGLLSSDGGPVSSDGGPVSSDGGPVSSDGGLFGDAGAQSNSIEVRGQLISHVQGGIEFEPLDPSTFALSVLTPDGSFVSVSPITSDAGLRFDAIPPGVRYLRHGTSWHLDVNERVDFTRHVLGRPDRVITDGGTTLRLAVTGLTPWSQEMKLQLTAPNANLFSFRTALMLSPPLGATSVTRALDYGQLDSPAALIDSDRGDVATLSLFEPVDLHVDGGTPFVGRALTRAGALAPLKVSDHATTDATVALSLPTAQGQLAVSLRRSAFATLVPAMAFNPRPELYEGFYVSALPFTGEVGEYASAPDLWWAEASGSGDASTDLSIAATYRNPYPSSWPETVQYIRCAWARAVPIREGVVTSTYANFVCTWVADLAAHASMADFTPAVGPPRELKIDDLEAMSAAGRVVRDSFMVSWSPPSIGNPTGYRVALRTTTRLIATFWTTGRSVKIPPGLLTPGQSYVIRVAAEQGVDRRATPDAQMFPSVRTEVGSGVVVVDDGQCARANGGCAFNATCTPGNSGPSCRCNEGYQGTGQSCSEINECAVNNGGCGTDSSCVDLLPGSSCLCNLGACPLTRAWRRAGPIDGSDVQMVYDAARAKTMVVGSGGNGISGGTWAWNGSAWSLASNSGPTSEVPRLTYDSLRRKVVLMAASGTWEWDGSAWEQKSVQAFITRAPMAFDDRRGLTVAYLDGTLFEWAGTSWATGSLDGPRLELPGMAYDSSRRRLVLTGFATSGFRRGETWEYDGSTWERRSSTAAVGKLYYDVARAHVVRLSSTQMQWTGTAWAPLSNPPPGQLWSNVVYDSARSCTIALVRTGLIEECGGTWTQKTFEPASQVDNVAVTDPVRQTVVLFNTEGPWSWNGAQWAKAASGAPDIARPSFTFDSSRSVFVAIGVTPDLSKYETWEWNGTASNFTKKSSTGPLPGDGHSIAYDPVRNQTVLFGGVQFSGATWLWNGTAWSSPSVSGPPARAGHSMVYDPLGQRIILAGGARASTFFDDTWSWNGSVWTRIVEHMPAELGAGYIISMAYDPNHGGVVAPTVSGTWLLTGTQWSKLDATSVRGALAYDPTGKSLLSFSNDTAWWF